MSWRGTLALLILAGIALVFLVLTGRSKTHSPLQPLLGINPVAANVIEIHEGGNYFAFFKWNGDWIVKKHLEDGAVFRDRANPQLIQTLLEAAADITPLDILSPRDLKNGLSLDALGLKKPNRAITFHAGNTETLWIGAEGAAPDSLYIRLDSGKSIYLISGKIAPLAFRSPQEFRDPRLTSLPTDRIDAVSLVRGNSMQQLNFRKAPETMTSADKGWVLESPLSAKGDDKVISSLLDSLLGAKIMNWMPEGTDLTTCGLDTPAAIIKIHEEASKTPLTISVGSIVPGTSDNYFVHCSDRPGICVVGGGIKNLLSVTPQSLRLKKISQIEYDMVDRIKVDNYSLKRKAGSEDWIGNDAGKSNYEVITEDRMKKWYDQLQKLNAVSFEVATPEHLAQRGLANLQGYGLTETNHPVSIQLIATLSENTAQEEKGETILAEYFFGTVTDNEIALREGNAAELLILPAGSVDFLKEFQARSVKP